MKTLLLAVLLPSNAFAVKLSDLVGKLEGEGKYYAFNSTLRTRYKFEGARLKDGTIRLNQWTIYVTGQISPGYDQYVFRPDGRYQENMVLLGNTSVMVRGKWRNAGGVIKITGPSNSLTKETGTFAISKKSFTYEWRNSWPYTVETINGRR